MGANWNEVSENGGTGDVPEMVEESPGVYVTVNAERVYDEPDWEWAEVAQLIEGGI